MFSAAMHLLPIKDLKDFRVLLPGVSIDMQDLKNLKRCFFTGACFPKVGQEKARLPERISLPL